MPIPHSKSTTNRWVVVRGKGRKEGLALGRYLGSLEMEGKCETEGANDELGWAEAEGELELDGWAEGLLDG